jgi:NADH dehydrogenase/NADH:ubiquinone oxidoreductase subunit G
MSNLYVFIDESGNFDFSLKGTRHLVMCAYSTFEPEQSSAEFQKLKYAFLSNGIEQECFHATEDLQEVRNGVFNLIKTKSTGVFDIVSIQKNKTNPIKRDKKEVYTLLVKTLLGYIFRRHATKKPEKIVVIIDQALTKKEQGHLKQIIKSQLKTFNVHFHLYFFATKSDHNSQIADYGSWSKYVKIERNETRPFAEINHLVKSEFDVFRTGTTEYY